MTKRVVIESTLAHAKEEIMRSRNFKKSLFSVAFALSIAVTPYVAAAQSAVSLPKNKYRVRDDVRLGRETSVKVEQQFPILQDEQLTAYIQRVGDRLVAALPTQFRQSEFDYRFKVVNASDINAFALPGGPMYVNRGMIEAARNEGEMAGVMAHEISHIALRHATAQATKQSSAGSVLGQLGLILGGAVVGGQTGAQLGAAAATAWMTKYSREYETQADILGARILADAGYDPRDLANMFQTIANRERSRGPEWLSSHPDPGNRYEKINFEAAKLNVSRNPYKLTRDFQWAQARVRGLPPARTMAQIQRDHQSGRGSSSDSAMAGGRYSNNVMFPSTRTRVFYGSGFELDVPSNWREFPANDGATFAPDGAYGDRGITHGAMIGVFRSQDSDLADATDRFVNGLLQGNEYLRRNGGSTNAYISSMRGYSTELSGRSPITGSNELATVYTARLRNGNVFYVITVVPENETYRYDDAIRSLLSSARFR
jgi:Zn-dependent protease with chaperone function